jgi:hypothetical protein
VAVDFEIDAADSSVRCTAQVETLGRTGVEMEALTAVQVGLLTVYDMCKAADRGMVMGDIRVLEKHGGKSGDWVARKNLFRWGLVAGAAGGPFLVQPGLVWQIVGFVVIFLISNYHVNRAAQRIPRWHAVFFSLAGAMLAMFVIVTIGSILIAYSQTQ